MAKIGIVSCYFKYNYGSMLQAYATQKVLDDNMILNETISIDDNIDFKMGKRSYYKKQIFNFKFIKSKFGMIKFKFDKILNKKLKRNVAKRNTKFAEFKREFHLSKACGDYKALAKLANDKYSTVIVGSDQLWLPVNVYADYYTLNWVPDSINKVSYATSFGISNIPSKYNQKYEKFLKRINHLSVREESGVKIIDKFALHAELVCDPTLLLTKEQWSKVMVQDRLYNEPYILCYFLGNNKKHRKFAERLKKETGYKIVSLNHNDEYVKYSDKFCDYAPYDVGPKEWVNLIAHAEYVLTDSFHGTVFSLLFNKTFFDFRRHKAKNKMSTNSRLDSLLNLAGINKERILTGEEKVEDVLKYHIDYDLVNKNLNDIREKSKAWLLSSLVYKDEEPINRIDQLNKCDCTGCNACFASCPKDAITMQEDEEGFKYPIIDNAKCINCSLCAKVCRSINPKSSQEHEQYGYIVQHKNAEILKESTSGGAFSALSDYIIDQGGVVVGATFDGEECYHYIAKSKDELAKFRSSKYVQSNLRNTFKEVRELLQQGVLVLYSGTGCQIEGLKAFLHRDYENLFTIDVVCRAVPSPKVLSKYLEYKESKYKKKVNIRFRDKTIYGYNYSNLSLKDENNKMVWHGGVDNDEYLKLFFEGYCSRPSCHSCKFRKLHRESDMTIWDCFGIRNYSKELDNNKGVTRVLIHSKKGKELFEHSKDQLSVVDVDSQKLIVGVKEMFYSSKENPRREEFMNDLNQLSNEKLFKKYTRRSFKSKVIHFIKLSLMKTELYSKLKALINK